MDPFGYAASQKPERYLIVFVPLYATIIVRNRRNRLSVRELRFPEVVLFILFVYGLFGSVVGLLQHTTRNSALVVFAVMPLGLLQLSLSDPLEELAAERYLRLVALLGTAVVVLHSLTAIRLLPAFSPGGGEAAAGVGSSVFSHERGFILCTALAAAWLMGRRRLFILLSLLCLVIFLTYPAGTFIIVAFTTVMILIATIRGASWKVSAVAGIMILGVIAASWSAAVATRQPGTSNLAISYFSTVGKNDNSATRAVLWHKAWQEVKSSPIYGHAFTRDITFEVDLSGRLALVPPHNDLLQYWVGGGTIAAALVATWVISTNVAAIRTTRHLNGLERASEAHLLRTCLVCFDGFMVTALFNPVSAKLGLQVLALLSFAVIMQLGIRRDASGPTSSGPIGARPDPPGFGTRSYLDGRVR